MTAKTRYRAFIVGILAAVKASCLPFALRPTRSRYLGAVRPPYRIALRDRAI